MKLGIHHIALTVRDMDESVAWYRSVFDAEVVERYSKHDMEIAHIKIGNARLELFSSGVTAESLPEYRKSLQSDIRVVGTKHICLETDSLDALMEKLKKQNVKFATEVDTAGFGGRYVFIQDPNGILIELYQA